MGYLMPFWLIAFVCSVFLLIRSFKGKSLLNGWFFMFILYIFVLTCIDFYTYGFLGGCIDGVEC